MLLLHVDDLGYDEIGAILGITSNAVQVRISRARQKLRKTKVYRQLYERSATEAVGSAEAPEIESRHTTPTPDPSCSSRVSGSLRS